MTTFLVLAAGMVLGEAKASPVPVANRRENFARVFADSIRFDPNFCAKRDPVAEDAFMVFVRELAFETALRLLPRDDVVNRAYDLRWATDRPLSLTHMDEPLAIHWIELSCLRFHQRIMHGKWGPTPFREEEMSRLHGSSRMLNEVPPFVDAYFEYVITSLEGLVHPSKLSEEFLDSLGRTRAWVAANLVTPLPEDADARLTSTDFDGVVAELRETIEQHRADSAHMHELNSDADVVTLNRRITRQFVEPGPFFVGRRYIEMAWNVGLIVQMPREALEYRIIELREDQEIALRDKVLGLRQLVDCEALGEGPRQFYLEQLQRLEERPY